MYDLHKRQAQIIANWQSTKYEPDLVEIFNAKSNVYHDMFIEYPKVISSAATSGSDLEHSGLYTEISRKKMQDLGLIAEGEGENFTPSYL